MTDTTAQPPVPDPQAPAGPEAQPAAPWRIDGVARRQQEAAVRSAARAGLPLADWLGRAIDDAAGAQGARAWRRSLVALAIGLLAGVILGGAGTHILSGSAHLPAAPPPEAGPSVAAAPPAQAPAPAQAPPPAMAAAPSAASQTPRPEARVPPADPFADLRRAARNGDLAAQFELGARHADGDGVPQDWAEAARWFRSAAEGGMGPAQHNLAVLYERGRGLDPDPREAARWYERAAAQGYAPSQFNLGIAYARGIDGTPDMERAVAWLERAAERLPQGNLVLGEIFESDIAPGGRDLGRARTHYLLAAAAGDPRAAARLEDLTPEVAARETLREIQQRLARLRLYAGEADGLTGPRTSAAIRRFQRDQKLAEDGRPSQALLTRLRAATPEP